MKKVGVALAVLGVVCLVVGLFPGLVMSDPAPDTSKFGPMQKGAVIGGGVLVLVGLILLCVGKKKPVAEAAAPAPEAPAAPAAPPEPPEPPAEQ